jgi:glycosyltransferase involved in cell wall biosynthesis
MKNTKFEISVIIPTYNRSLLLCYTLDTLLKQDISKDKFEVIVCDDGSNDNTAERVKEYSPLINLKYVFQEDKGFRPASARNNGIRMAEGKICLFIDSGVLLNSNCLSEHIHFHRKKQFPKAAIGYVYGFDHDKNSEDLLKQLVVTSDPKVSIDNLSKHSVFHDVREPHYVRYNDRIENLPAPWFYFWTCHLSIDMDDLFVSGFFDETYDGRWGVEDNDLGYRLHQNGVKLCLLRAATSIHYPHEKNAHDRKLEGYQNSLYFHNKFNTPETKLFLDNFRADSLVDINSLSLKMYSPAIGK